MWAGKLFVGRVGKDFLTVGFLNGGWSGFSQQVVTDRRGK